MLKLGMIDVEMSLGHDHLLSVTHIVDCTHTMLDMFLIIIHNKHATKH